MKFIMVVIYLYLLISSYTSPRALPALPTTLNDAKIGNWLRIAAGGLPLRKVTSHWTLENVESQEGAQNIRRHFMKRVDAFTLPDKDFIRNFRLSKGLVHRLINMLRPYVTESTRSSALDIPTKVLHSKPTQFYPISLDNPSLCTFLYN
eukprot:XP_016657182.1 PREDICTED: uncharacterized protein LOC107882785 [Acyrthosiphon pisum]